MHSQKIKPPFFSLLFFLLAAITPLISQAQSYSVFADNTAGNKSEIITRVQPAEAEFMITNRENSVDLVLTSESVVVQFTDDFLDELEKEIEHENSAPDESHLADIIRSAVSSGVRTMLSKAISVPYSEIESIHYEYGRIILMDKNGEELFTNLEVSDTDIMEDFKRRDAKRFVSKAERKLF